ncbi:MAG: RlmE family RNA methyltransferase [Proteobacteria bacterium]|nr:RlmE family RNA methyltransferase [Pseudomonadota bacterium]
MGKFIPKDTFYKKAKQDGYRARSAYKLKEIQDKYHIIKKDDKVLDLGCAPGSFLQVISEIVGQEGLVVGIDILPVSPLPYKNILTMVNDIRNINMSDMFGTLSITRFDVITCDIAPNLSGIREADDKNIEELYEAAKIVVVNGLKKGGNIIFKSFFTEAFKERQKDLKKLFSNVVVFKPSSSRSISSEIYLVCTVKKTPMS